MDYPRNREETGPATWLSGFFSHFYFAHCTEMAQAVYDLAKLKYGPAIVVLVRTMVESTIDLAYLWACGDIIKGADDREAWIDYHYLTRAAVGTMTNEMRARREKAGLPFPTSGFETQESDAYQAEAKAFEERYQRTNWPKMGSVRDRAYKVDLSRKLFEATGALLEDDYIFAYKWSSQVVHGSVGAANAYICETDTDWQVNFSPGQPYLNIGLSMATRFLVQVLAMANHIAH